MHKISSEQELTEKQNNVLWSFIVQYKGANKFEEYMKTLTFRDDESNVLKLESINSSTMAGYNNRMGFIIFFEDTEKPMYIPFIYARVYSWLTDFMNESIIVRWK